MCINQTPLPIRHAGHTFNLKNIKSTTLILDTLSIVNAYLLSVEDNIMENIKSTTLKLLHI